MFTYLSEGDVSLSISLTGVVSLITPFTIPLVVALAMDFFIGSSAAFVMPIAKTILQLLLITVIPVMLGMFVLSRWPLPAGKLERGLKWFSILFLMLIVVLIVLKNADKIGSFFAQAGAPTLLLNVVVLVLGYQLANWASLPLRQAI
jgi:BASS family bile acid:Na+ symporter